MTRTIGLAALAATAALLAGCTSGSAPQPKDRQTRVAEYFQRSAGAIATKEGIPAGPTAYLAAGEYVAADGTAISLWVSNTADPTKVRSRCFYLDSEQRDGGAGGYGGCGAPEGRQVSLSGDATGLVGSVGSWNAASVRITGNGSTQTAQIVSGYFLVPVALTTPPTPLTLTLLDKAGAELGTVADLTPPGSAVPVSPTPASPSPSR